MMGKLAFASAVLRLLHKEAGVTTPLMIGAGTAGTLHLTRKSLDKAKYINDRFYPQVGEHE